jgi:hypothetical protein
MTTLFSKLETRELRKKCNERTATGGRTVLTLHHSSTVLKADRLWSKESNSGLLVIPR